MKNKEKNVLQPHILTKYHEIDVLVIGSKWSNQEKAMFPLRSARLT